MSIAELPVDRRGGIGKVVIRIGSDSITAFSNALVRPLGKVERTPKPYPKSIQARKEASTRKSSLPDELREPYESVEAALLTVLGMSSSEEVGDMGRGERGGSETPYNNLMLLKTRLSNRQIAEEFLNNEAMKEYRKDPFARNKVIAALGTLKNAFPPNVPS